MSRKCIKKYINFSILVKKMKQVIQLLICSGTSQKQLVYQLAGHIFLRHASYLQRPLRTSIGQFCTTESTVSEIGTVKSGLANSGWKKISGPKKRSQPTSMSKFFLVTLFIPVYFLIYLLGSVSNLLNSLAISGQTKQCLKNKIIFF